MTSRNLFQINYDLLLLIFNYLVNNNIPSYISMAYTSRASKHLVYSIMKRQAERNGEFRKWIARNSNAVMGKPHHESVQQQMKEYFLFFNFKTNYNNYDNLTVAKSAIQNHSIVDIRALSKMGFDFSMKIENNITLMQSVLCFDIYDKTVFKQRCEIFSEMLKMGYFPKDGARKFLAWLKRHYEPLTPKYSKLSVLPYPPRIEFYHYMSQEDHNRYWKIYKNVQDNNNRIMKPYNEFNSAYKKLYECVENLLNGFKNEYKRTCTLFNEIQAKKSVRLEFSHNNSIELVNLNVLNK